MKYAVYNIDTREVTSVHRTEVGAFSHRESGEEITIIDHTNAINIPENTTVYKGICSDGTVGYIDRPAEPLICSYELFQKILTYLLASYYTDKDNILSDNHC